METIEELIIYLRRIECTQDAIERSDSGSLPRKSKVVKCALCLGTGIGPSIFRPVCKVCGGIGKLRV